MYDPSTGTSSTAPAPNTSSTHTRDDAPQKTMHSHWYRDQNYWDLRDECLARNELFVDPAFPPHNKSLFYSHVDALIEWRRPREISPRPGLVVDGVSALDLIEGELGNGWFVSAAAWLTRYPVLFRAVRIALKLTGSTNICSLCTVQLL